MKLLSMALGEHDSNFSFYDGKNVKYYKTERVHQIKHHTLTDLNSWKKEIFDVWGLNFNEVDEIAIVIDPWIYKLPYEKYFFPVKKFNSLDVNCEVTQINHHYAHALSSRMLGESSIDFVFDGFGDPDVSWSVFKNDKLIEKGSVEKNGSLGILIAEAAVFMGVKAKHGLDLAGKFMGLQSYGNIDYEYLKFLNKFDLYNVKNVFNYNNWVSHKKDETVANLTKLDWARTIHFRVGEILVDYFKTHASSNDTISFSGGVAQNIIWNTELRKQFPKIIIPPHCTDEGLSIGALEYLRIKNNLPKFNFETFPYCQSDESVAPPSDETIQRAAQFLSEGKIVAWYQGNGEIGPRALGNRSILMDPRILNGKNKINSIKNRENYRPFGASILKNHTEEYFLEFWDSPYMLYAFELKKLGLDSVKHIDGTCRAQVVEADTVFGKLLQKFYELTNCPMLLNTSLNTAGKPIAGYTQNAKDEFFSKNIDVLFVGNQIFKKD